jgi:hypothetical protein
MGETFVNGGPVEDRFRLRVGDLVGVGGAPVDSPPANMLQYLRSYRDAKT